MEEKPTEKIVAEPETTKTTISSDKNIIKISVPVLMIAVIATITFVGLAGVSIWYTMDQQIVELTRENADLTEAAKSSKTSKIGNVTISTNSDGIVTTKTTMYQINDIQNVSWQYDKPYANKTYPLIDYVVNSVTLTPVVADMGAYRGNYTDKNWVVVEIEAKDTRTSGQGRSIIIADSIRIVDGNTKIQPIYMGESYYIAPLESKTVYAFFPVDKDIKSFRLWTGDLANPTITNLNFDSKTVSAPYGYFLMKSGYSSELQKNL